MAIDRGRNETAAPAPMLPGMARLAGTISAMAALSGAVGALTYAVTADLSTGVMVAQLFWAGIFGCVLIGSVAALVRKQEWSQKFLLGFWTLLGALSAVSLMAVLLWGTPAGWEAFMPGVHPAWLLAPALGVSVLVMALWTAATRPGSRLRYGSVVAVTVGIAITVLLILNMVFRTEGFYYRGNVETLDRYRLSQRERVILDGVESPVHITVDYEEDQDARSQRVMDLLDEMREYNRNVEVELARTDLQKARVRNRISEQASAQAREHVQLLETVVTKAPALAAASQTKAQQFSQLGPDSYLQQWGINAMLQQAMDRLAQDWTELGKQISSELTAPQLPDYASLVSQTTQRLGNHLEFLNVLSQELQLYGEFSTVARAQRQEILTAADKAIAALADVSKAIAPAEPAATAPATSTAPTTAPGADSEEDPADVLRRFAGPAKRAGAALTDLVTAINALGEGEQLELLLASKNWRIGEITLLRYFQIQARQFTGISQQVDALIETYTRQVQAQFVADFRRQMPTVLSQAREARDGLKSALDALTTIDAPTQQVLTQARNDELFATLRGEIAQLNEAAKELPELEQGNMGEALAAKNKIIIEAGGKTEIVSFEDAWPARSGAAQLPGDETAEQPRVFHGGPAIASRILSLTRKPFAQVLVTYWRPEGQMARMVAGPTPANVSFLQGRLRQANFTVTEWNLAEDRPTAPAGTPQVLLILPPPISPPANPFMPQQAPQFGPEQVAKIRSAVDGGTPAIFLASFNWPQRNPMGMAFTPEYALDGYLLEDWGIDVVSDERVVATVPAADAPGKYRISLSKFSHYPLSHFGDHPIGKPLQGQRMLWNDLCPVRSTESAPEGVSRAALLSVPDGAEGVWATGDLEAFIRYFYQQEGGYVEPDFAGPDRQPPFPVALTATRAATDDRQPGRIVVMSTFVSLMDDYINQPGMEFGPDGTAQPTDPPHSNADIVTNSVYWLIGREQMIAAGPQQTQPIEQFSETTGLVVRILCIVVLPMLVLLAGGVMWTVRRK